MTTNDLDFLNKRTKKYEVILGVDPDSKASGLCVLVPKTKEIAVLTLTFPQLLEKFTQYAHEYVMDIIVIVEASWLKQSKNGNTANWHVKPGDNLKVASAKGEGIARNQQVGRLIVEMCKHWSIDVIEKAPLIKSWNGPDRKITQEEIEYFIPGFPSKSNPETRDATLLAWDFAGFPIKVKPRTT